MKIKNILLAILSIYALSGHAHEVSPTDILFYEKNAQNFINRYVPDKQLLSTSDLQVLANALYLLIQWVDNDLVAAKYALYSQAGLSYFYDDLRFTQNQQQADSLAKLTIKLPLN